MWYLFGKHVKGKVSCLQVECFSTNGVKDNTFSRIGKYGKLLKCVSVLFHGGVGIMFRQWFERNWRNQRVEKSDLFVGQIEIIVGVDILDGENEIFLVRQSRNVEITLFVDFADEIRFSRQWKRVKSI